MNRMRVRGLRALGGGGSVAEPVGENVLRLLRLAGLILMGRIVTLWKGLGAKMPLALWDKRSVANFSSE